MDFEVRPVREDEREECLALWCAAFPDTSEAYFRRYFYGDVEWLPYYTQVGVLDGKLVSCVQIVKRVVACGEYRLTMGGIANVSTLPQYRGRGFNTACLRKAISVMEADAMDFSMLGTGINDYYAREGFETLPMPWLSGVLKRGGSPQPGGLSTRAAQVEDVERIQAIYDRYNRQRPIAVQRNAAYWRDWVGVSTAQPPGGTLVAEDRAGSVVGYVRYEDFHSDAPGKSVYELGVDDTAPPEATRTLIETVALQSNPDGTTLLRLSLPLEPAIVNTAQDLVTDFKIHYAGGSMVRMLHRDSLLRSLTIAMNERWLAAGRPSGYLDVLTPYGPTRLDATGSFVHAEPIVTAEKPLSQAAFLGLLFGLNSVEQVASESAPQPLIAALFPAHSAVYYHSDGF